MFRRVKLSAIVAFVALNCASIGFWAFRIALKTLSDVSFPSAPRSLRPAIVVLNSAAIACARIGAFSRSERSSSP
ncbi:hypothetical protein D3C80_1886420 [compost metagenome]